MRVLAAITVVLLAILPLQAAEVPGNALTTQETADGWVLLFDGQTVRGWRIEGDSEVVEGVLVLGGNQLTRAHPRTSFQPDFQLVFDYRVEGSEGAGASVNVTHSGGWDGFGRGSRGLVTPAASDWLRTTLTRKFDVRSGMHQETLDCRVIARNEPFGGGSGGSNGKSDVSGVWFEVQPGSKLFLRNIKLQGRAPGPSIWSILLFVMTLLLAGGLTAWLIVRLRKKRRGGKPPARPKDEIAWDTN